MFFRTKQFKDSDKLKIIKMEIVGIYKNLVVTYQEFEQALLKLGYHKVQKKEATHYVNDEFDSIVYISNLNTPDRKMILGEFAANAYLMEMKGVLENRDDIAKMIEQDRLDAQARSTNTNQGISS